MLAVQSSIKLDYATVLPRPPVESHIGEYGLIDLYVSMQFDVSSSSSIFKLYAAPHDKRKYGTNCYFQDIKQTVIFFHLSQLLFNIFRLICILA